MTNVMREKSPWTWISLGFVLAVAGIAALGLLIMRAQSAPRGVRPVIWDKETCAACRMAISERGFAAQLQTGNGRVLDFDDPGCLMAYLADEHPDVYAIYFHAMKKDIWLKQDQVAFQSGIRSPMGYGLGAVPAGTPGASSYEQAFQKVRDLRSKRGDH